MCLKECLLYYIFSLFFHNYLFSINLSTSLLLISHCPPNHLILNSVIFLMFDSLSLLKTLQEGHGVRAPYFKHYKEKKTFWEIPLFTILS